MNRFKFRVWAKDSDDDGCVGYLKTRSPVAEGLEFFYDGCWRGVSHYMYFPQVFTTEQWTGLKDKNGVEIYEGDIIKFEYWVGDFAWESMEEEEAQKNTEMLGKEYIGVITQSLNKTCNLEIFCGNPEKEKSPFMIFPLSYASSGEVIGDINENPDLYNG